MMETQVEETVPTGKLDNWYKCTAIEGKLFLYGNVSADVRERFVDGTFIHTSFITDKDQTFEEGSIVKTTYSTYLLGKERSLAKSKTMEG